MWKSVKSYVNFFRKKSVREFQDKEAVRDYLESEVFTEPLFGEHIRNTASQLGINEVIVYSVITDHLTNILYEIDVAIEKERSSTRIYLYGYITFKIKFMNALKGKKMFLEKFIKHKKESKS